MGGLWFHDARNDAGAMIISIIPFLRLPMLPSSLTHPLSPAHSPETDAFAELSSPRFFPFLFVFFPPFPVLRLMVHLSFCEQTKGEKNSNKNKIALCKTHLHSNTS